MVAIHFYRVTKITVKLVLQVFFCKAVLDWGLYFENGLYLLAGITHIQIIGPKYPPNHNRHVGVTYIFLLDIDHPNVLGNFKCRTK